MYSREDFLFACYFGDCSGIFGYLYPAYECYKAKEGARPDPEVINEWLSYWLVISLFTVAQTIGDMFLFW